MDENLNEQDKVANKIIGKMDEHDITNYILRKKVEEETKTYLNKLWKIVVVIATILGILLGILGYNQYSSFEQIRKSAEDKEQKIENIEKDINDKAKKLEERNAALEATIIRVKELADAANVDVQDAKNDSRSLIEATRNSANQTYDLITQSTNILSQMYANLNTAQNKLTAAQNKIEEQVAATTQQINNIKERQSSIDTQLTQATDTNEQIKDLAKVFSEQYRTVKGQVQEVRDLESVQKQLSQAKSLEIVMLRTNTSNTVKLRTNTSNTVKMIDFEALKSPVPYSITFYAEQLRRPYHLKVKIEKQSPVKPTNMDCKGVEAGNLYKIDGSPFIFKVDFVYHTIWSRDFISLKVIHEGILSPEDKARLLDCKEPPSIAIIDSK
jgi:hypothetical protein